jgi:hypothetical protein
MSKGLGINHPTFFHGIVESRDDPLQLGRVRVRVFGIHSDSVSDVPTDKLPWAQVILPANNGSNSGVGWSPNGIVEGTMVLVYFADGTDFQKPVVIGSVPGLNSVNSNVSGSATSSVTPPEPSIEQTTTDSAATSAQTVTWTLGQTSEPFETQSGAGPDFILNDVHDARGKLYGPWLISLDTGELRTFIKNHTSFSSNFAGIVLGSPSFDATWKEVGSSADSAAFKEDQKTFIQNTHYTILLRNLNKYGLGDRGNGVQDCIWSVAFQYGPDTTLIDEALGGKQLDSLTDADIVTLIQNHRKNTIKTIFKDQPEVWASNEARSDTEKDALLALCEDSATSASKKVEAPEKDSYGQDVYKPVDFTKNASTRTLASFRDPSGKYPTKLYKGMPDTNRLARNYKSNTTIVKVKQNSTIKGNGFAEPATKYAALYPFNKVFQSESGHVMEFDDTDGAERVHIYHRAGTFIEFHPDGTIVRKSMKDDVEIVVSNKSCYIVGNCNVIIEGDSNTKVMGNMTASVQGNIDFKAEGNISMMCNGELKLAATKTASMTGGTTASLISPQIAFTTGAASPITIDKGEKVKAELALADDDVPPGPEDDASAVTTDANSVHMPAFDETATATPKDISETEAVINEAALGEEFSKHYVLGDFTTNVAMTSQRGSVVSQCGLSKDEIILNLRTLARNIVDPIADKFGKDAFVITNAFRLENGTTSHHLSGCAVDLQFTGMAAKEYPHVAEQIRQILPAFTQIILEYHGNNPIIHIGYAKDKSASPFSRLSGNVKDVFTTYDAKFTRFRTSAGLGGFFDKNRNLIHTITINV